MGLTDTVVNQASSFGERPILWIGGSPDICEAALKMSYQQPCMRVELNMLTGLVLTFVEIRDGRTIKQTRMEVGTASAAFVHVKLMSFFRAYDSGLAVLEYDETTAEFWATFFDRTGLDFCLWFKSKVDFNWSHWAFLCAATCRIVASEDLLSWWNSTLIFDAELARDPNELVENISSQIPHLANRDAWNELPISAESKHTLTLISYYMPPVRSVAMQRLEYWHEQLAEISEEIGYPVEPHIITATNHYAHPRSVKFVKDFGNYVPCSGAHKEQFEALRENKINTIGVSWAQNIRQMITENPDVFATDFVLLSGNPFFYFDLGELYKELYDAAVILDFRDPFANNPRIRFKSEQRALLQSLEHEYLNSADAILAVNKACLDLVKEREDSPIKRVEIANGYDERIVDTVEPADQEPSDLTQFIYAGTFYRDCSPIKFVDLMDANRQAFIHYGKRQPDHDELLEKDAFDWRGPVPYRDLLANIKVSDIGLIFTGGEPFEHTTKIFDYIGADIDVLVVTEGTVKSGEIHNLTQELDRIYWIRNDPDEISAFLESYKPSRRKRPQRGQFSRRAQAESLINLLRKIEQEAQTSHSAKREPVDSQATMSGVSSI